MYVCAGVETGSFLTNDRNQISINWGKGNMTGKKKRLDGEIKHRAWDQLQVLTWDEFLRSSTTRGDFTVLVNPKDDDDSIGHGVLRSNSIAMR